MTYDTKQVTEDAEVTAIFMRTLVAQQVPTQIAVTLASSYITSVINARMIGGMHRPPDDPGEPWRGEDK